MGGAPSPAGGLFVFGLGYTTAGVARQAQAQQWHVTSTSRAPRRWAPVEGPAHRVVLFDPAGGRQLDRAPEAFGALVRSHYVLSSIPPVAASLYDPVLRSQLRLLREAAASEGCAIRGLGFLSSTGVYGHWQGGWVDESCEPRPATARGVLRLEAEGAWAALAEQLGLPLTIFRLGGIYGPERSVLHHLMRQQQGQQQPAPRSSAERRGRQKFTARCHVADVARAVLADMQRRRRGGVEAAERRAPVAGEQQRPESAGRQQAEQQAEQQQQQQQEEEEPAEERRRQRPAPGLGGGRLVEVFNVVDDQPAPRGDVELYAAQLLAGAGAAGAAGGASEPPEPAAAAAAAAEGQAAPQQRGPPEGPAPGGEARPDGGGGRRPGGEREPLEEKRVRNARLKGPPLRVDLLAPSYREGLQMLARGGLDPFAPEDLLCLFGGGAGCAAGSGG